MKVAVTGATGLIGSALVPHLKARGDDVLRLVRRATTAADEVSWDPETETVDVQALHGVDAIVHLAGVGVGDRRWTADHKKAILDSRVKGTRAIARTIAQLDPKPATFVSASAIGFYGDTGDQSVDESSPAGTGFLADVVQAWEGAAQPAIDAGIRTVHPRTGLVVSSKGGAWEKLFPIFRLGLGGRLGDGRQYWSWISLRDEIAALTFLLDEPSLAGAVNLTGPEPCTNSEITAAMRRVLGRPAILPVPSFALKAVLGEFSTEVLSSARVLPGALTSAGFSWLDTTVESAIRAAAA